MFEQLFFDTRFLDKIVLVIKLEAINFVRLRVFFFLKKNHVSFMVVLIVSIATLLYLVSFEKWVFVIITVLHVTIELVAPVNLILIKHK